jgi:RNA polymerase sigma-70 factor (ECF subfamily)
LRRRREVELNDEVAAEIADDSPSAEARLADADVAATIARLMERLSVDHRVVLQLAYFQEFSVSQIAEILDCPENTVKTRMFYARQRLKALLEAEGIEGAAA